MILSCMPPRQEVAFGKLRMAETPGFHSSKGRLPCRFVQSRSILVLQMLSISAQETTKVPGPVRAWHAPSMADKAGMITADRSHDPVLAAFLGLGSPLDISELSVSRLLPFYNRLAELADAAYE